MVNNECRFQIKNRCESQFFLFVSVWDKKKETINLRVLVCKILKTDIENKYKLKRAGKTKLTESHFVYKRVNFLCYTETAFFPILVVSPYCAYNKLKTNSH